jgi:opacity protein-like surface antigen
MRFRFLLAAAAVLIPPLLAPAGAWGQPYADPGTGAGLLGFVSRTPDAAGPTFLGGAQVLTRFTGVLGVELFIGYGSCRYEEDGTTVLGVQQLPVQLSALVYLLPNLRVQPYLLGGVGYYRIWATGEGPLAAQGRTIENKFAFHAGAGIDVRTGRAVSIRVEGRYVFLDVDAVTQIGKSANSWQAGAGFNVYF